MKEHQVGIASGSLPGRPIHEELELLKRAGFEATFTGWGPDKDFAGVAEAVRRSGLYYSSIHAPFFAMGLKTYWGKGDAGDAAEASLHACIDSCEKYEVPVMVMHSFIGMEEAMRVDRGGEKVDFRVGLERTRRLAGHAEKAGVKIAIENTEGEAFLRAMMRETADSPAVGFCLDSGHELCYNGGQDFLAEFGDRLCYLHINSNLGSTTGDGTITWKDDAHMLPFDGKVDMEFLARRLKKLNYRGDLVMELNRTSRPDRDANDRYAAMSDEDYLAEAYARICRLKALVEAPL